MNKETKKVLVVDDEEDIRDLLKYAFAGCSEKADCPYRFEVDIAESAAECVQQVRIKSYDIIVLDKWMETKTIGLEVSLAFGLEAFAFALGEQFGWETPIRILFTGYPSYQDCVKAMRQGAWDYIVKEDVGNTSAFQIVVNSAIARLRQLDLRREQEEQIAAEWLPQHFRELQTGYGGQLVALWHRPQVEIIASGKDAFELEDNLREWRSNHADWEQPFNVKIPSASGDEEQEG